MRNLAFSAFAAIAYWSRWNFLRKTHRMDEVQENFLRSLLQTHQDTAFGREYGFADIQTIDQFRERIPVQSYQAFAQYTQRMAHGEPNVLVADPLIYFNISSGSTGSKKLIPVTKRSRRVLARSNRTAAGFGVAAAARQNRPLGDFLYPISANSHGVTPCGIPYAPVSTSDARLTDRLSRQVYAHPFETFEISDASTRYYACLLFALRNRQLRVIGATFPVLALQMCDRLSEYSESLIEDLEKGTIASWLPIDGDSKDIRSRLEPKLSPYPQRAAELRQIVKKYGHLTPKHAWPHLSFVVTARGGTSNFYFQRFPEYFGDTPVFGGTYSCAEGVLGIHHDLNDDTCLPAMESTFLEFIPQDQWDAEFPKTILPTEAQAGERYRVVFSNYSGFYRYDLGDIVEVTGFYNQAPLFTFLHRQGNVMSSSTEKTTEAHVVEVMRRLQEEFQISLENFCITLSKDAVPAHYLVNIELASGQSHLSHPKQFLQRFDEVMKEVQKFYAIKRRDQIPLPRLRIMAPGSFERLRQRMLQQGVAESQLKFPHLTEDRNWLDGLPVLEEVRLEE